MIDIKCAYKSMAKVSDLAGIQHPRNYNEHGREQIELYCDIIKEQGIRRPVRISNLSGYMTGGHGLLKVAQALGIDELPVDYQDYDNEDQELSDLLADNNLARLARVNRNKRDSIVKELAESGRNLKLTGLSNEILDDILGNVKKIDFSTPIPGVPLNERHGMIDGGEDDPGYYDVEPDYDETPSDNKRREISNSRKRPIAIILDKSYYDLWEALKRDRFKVTGDTTAFMKMIDYFKERDNA